MLVVHDIETGNVAPNDTPLLDFFASKYTQALVFCLLDAVQKAKSVFSVGHLEEP
jgi:hypothetical protein